MRAGGLEAGAGRTTRVTASICVTLALASCAIASLVSHPTAGLALASGLLLGSVNGVLAHRSMAQALPIQMTSLGRLMLLSAAGLAIGFLLFPSSILLVIAGLALAQLTLAGVALREAVAL